MAHVPVLLEEILKSLDLEEGDSVIDGTVDGGGHAEAFLKKIGREGRLLGLDLDKEILSETKEKFALNRNVILLNANYAELPNIIQENKFPKANSLLLDLGFSSEQLGNGRGFSFRERNEPLLMTYSDSDRPVREWLPRLKEKELTNIIRNFGEERFAERISRSIKKAKQPILTVGDLADLIHRSVPKSYERGRIDAATRTFQALRIFANKELENLENILAHLSEVVLKGGRVAIISFHSLEDRIVKNKFRELAKSGVAEILTKKPIVATAAEIMENPRSRSAKLRIISIL